MGCEGRIAGYGGSLQLLVGVLYVGNIRSLWVAASDNAHWLFSAAESGNQAAGTMTRVPTQSHYPDTEPTSPWPIPVMPRAGLGIYKYPGQCVTIRLHRLPAVTTLPTLTCLCSSLPPRSGQTTTLIPLELTVSLLILTITCRQWPYIYRHWVG